MAEQILCRDLTLGYDNTTVAEKLDFSVFSGNYLCIVGENGAGKSTLIKTLLGLQKPMRGEIVWHEENRTNGIGYLPQQTDVQKDFPASVREIVRSGCLAKRGLRPFYNKTEKQLAKSTMTQLGIIHLSKKCYRELSGGLQQRVLLARALCATRETLLLDEPTAGLDPKAQTEMYDLIQNLNKQGVTIIMISHDISAAIKYASHILHIGNGQQLFFGKTTAYVKSDIAKAFITVSEVADND